MKLIKSKPSKTSATIHSLMRPPSNGAAAPQAERVLVVYGEADASIYYEAGTPRRVTPEA